jgi:hypothetical protein
MHGKSFIGHPYGYIPIQPFQQINKFSCHIRMHLLLHPMGKYMGNLSLSILLVIFPFSHLDQSMPCVVSYVLCKQNILECLCWQLKGVCNCGQFKRSNLCAQLKFHEIFQEPNALYYERIIQNKYLIKIQIFFYTNVNRFYVNQTKVLFTQLV